MQFTDWRVHCPVCDATRLDIDDHPEKTTVYHELACSCQQCDATFSVVYKVVDIEFMRYGNPIGPVYLTDSPRQALAAWEAEEEQWIRTDDTFYAVGYAPTLLDDGRRDDPHWRDTSPEELEALLAQV
jgi:hypothetical protein